MIADGVCFAAAADDDDHHPDAEAGDVAGSVAVSSVAFHVIELLCLRAT